MRDKELFCVKISTLKFLNKLCNCVLHNCENTQEVNDQMHDHVEDDRFIGSDQEQFSVRALLNTVNKQGVISQILGILSQKNCPLLMISLMLKLLSQLVSMDFNRAIPVLTSLDYWTVLVDLIDIQSLREQEVIESREILKIMQGACLSED